MEMHPIGIFLPGTEPISDRTYRLFDGVSAINGRVYGRNGVRSFATRARGRFAPLPGAFRGAWRASRFEGGWTLARVTTLDASLRHAVLSYLKRSGWSGMQFGELALGNPGFVPGLGKRRSLSLDTADRVLRFMGEPPIGPTFRREVEAFLKVTRTKPADFGIKAAGDPAFVDKLRLGVSTRLATVQQVRTWMRETASEAERASIAGELAAGEEEAAALAPDPAALGAPVATGSGPLPDEYQPFSPEEAAFLTTRQAAAFLSLSPRTLDRYRLAGKGPAFHRFGTRIAYARADLEEWAARRRRGRPSKAV